jgi:hypothetical protein
MNVGELRAKLARFDDDDEVYIGVPRHDYVGHVDAQVPKVDYKSIQGGCVVDDDCAADEHYISQVDDYLDENGIDPATITYKAKLEMTVESLEQYKPRVVVVID